jgi:N-acetylmuramoyl-L-alanine amidase
MSLSSATRLTISLLLLSQVSRLHAAEVQDVRMWRAPDHTRLVFDLSAAVDYTLFSLDNPDRLVIDIDSSATSQRSFWGAGR